MVRFFERSYIFAKKIFSNRNLQRAIVSFRSKGIRATISIVKRQLSYELIDSSSSPIKVVPSSKIITDPNLRALIDLHEVPLAPTLDSFNRKSLSIHWVIPDFSAGAGGHMTIFRTIKFLESFGHECNIWITQPINHRTSEEATKTLIQSFQHVKAKVGFVGDEFYKSSGDAIFATDWSTVSYVNSVSDFKRRFYFVQDHEPEFFPQGSYSITAKNTYAKDMDTICASPWLKSLMEDKYHRWATSFWLAVDRNIYSPPQFKTHSNIVRVAFYARHFTSRRAVELGLLAFEQLARMGIEFELHTFGAPLTVDKAPFKCISHGSLTTTQLCKLYQECDVGVVFSATNYSLIPQEMMACGLPVAELNMESTRAIFPKGVVTLLSSDPRNMAFELQAFIEDRGRWQVQSSAALKWVNSFSWYDAARVVETSVIERLEQHDFRSVDSLTKNIVKASVIIPTLNGGETLKKVITAIEKQQTPWLYEIVIVDSGSTDGTYEYLQSHSLVRVEQIDRSEFQHGRTRNYAISLTKGEFIAVLTQDAMPVDEYWLYNLVTSLEVNPAAAGAFGKHVAWHDASPFVKRDLTEHFQHFDHQPEVVSKFLDKRRWHLKDIQWKQFLHFFSDNNACLRRSIWEQIPYPEVEYGEDQLWAWEIIKAGYSKVYAKDAVVYHSHDYDATESEQRAYEETKFFKQHFGYKLIDIVNKQVALQSLNMRDSEWAKGNAISTSQLSERLAINSKRVEGMCRGMLS